MLAPNPSQSKTAALGPEQEKRFQTLMKRLEAALNEEEDSGFNEERERIIAELGALGRSVAPRLEEAFRRGNPENAPYVLSALAEADPERGALAAQEALRQHSNSTVRLTAVLILSAGEPGKQTAALRAAAKDSYGPVRRAAIAALGGTGDSEHVPTLMEALNDELPDVRDAALQALERCAGGVVFETKEEWQAWYEKRVPQGNP